jgi:hypothetical protein
MCISYICHNSQIMKNKWDITVTEHGLAIQKFQKEQEVAYIRSKENFLEKYGLTEIKTNKPRTALEPSN